MSHSGPGAALRAVNLVKTFGGGETATHVLRGASATLHPGEFVALVGASGSGKSTFLSIAGTLLRPTSGALEIAGVDVTQMGEDALGAIRNKHLGFVFQFHHLLEDFTALENVLMPVYSTYTRIPRPFLDRAHYLLERVGLADRMNFRPTKLSGGQKQRVAVARSLIMKPSLVLADEPTGNLDRENASDVLTLLRELGRDEGTAFLLSTHDASIADHCDRTLQMRDGVVAQGAAPVLLGAPPVAVAPPVRGASVI